MSKNEIPLNQIIKTKFDFENETSFENRCKLFSNLISKYPDRIPIIVTKAFNNDASDIKKKKYLVPKDYTLLRVSYEIRKQMTIQSDKTIILFINNTLLPSCALLSHIYDKYKNKDGFLYIIYATENTFG